MGGGGEIDEANLKEGHEAQHSGKEPDSVIQAVIVPHGQPSA